MLNRFFRDLAHAILAPPARALSAAGISPNALTLFGLFVIAAASWLISTGKLFAGGVVLAIGGIFDMIDGAVAEAGGKTSSAGAFLDSTIDRISDALLFLSIFWHYTAPPVWAITEGAGELVWETNLPLSLLGAEERAGALLALGALILGYLVSYIKARAEGLGFDCSIGVAERPERIVLTALGLLVDQLVPALSVLVLLSAITAVQRFAFVWSQARRSAAGSA